MILFAADKLFDRVLPYDMGKKSNWMMQMKVRCYDFAILGSSRAYHSVDIATMQQTLNDGKIGINLGEDGQPFDVTFMVLQCVLENNTIKHILLEVDIGGLDDSHFQLLSIGNYLLYLDRPVVFDIIKERCGMQAYMWRYVPFFKYAEFNDYIGLASVLRALMPNNLASRYDATGSGLIDISFQEKALRDNVPRTFRIDPIRVKYLVKILELAKAKNISISLFMAPHYSKVYKSQLNRGEIIRYYQMIANRYAVPFVVYDDPGICDNQDYFLDFIHLNKKGAIEFSRQLGHIFEQYSKERGNKIDRCN